MVYSLLLRLETKNPHTNYLDSSLLEVTENEFLTSLLPKELLDGRGKINAIMFPIAYGEKGYIAMS